MFVKYKAVGNVKRNIPVLKLLANIFRRFRKIAKSDY
jgi:hypothetical protein